MFSIFTFFVIAPSLLFLSVHGDKLVPCYFVFGDSLVDNGNNNNRATTAKANYPPYGVDYPGGPTGRFSNGRNVADFIAEALGFTDHVPPFANANADDFLNGVNYASASAGILSTTGKQFGDVISLDEQLVNHQMTIERIRFAVGSVDEAQNHLSKCIYYVGMGSNDYASYTMSVVKTPPQIYASQLIDVYSRQIRDLYNYGARKVALFGLGTIGCVPATLRGAIYGPTCLSLTNATSGVFNAMLKSLVDHLNNELLDAKFTYIDVFGITVSNAGFDYESLPCCVEAANVLCSLNSPVCSDRTKYAYFDGVHPTEAAAAALAKRAFTVAARSDAYPFDILNLALAE